MHMKPERDVTTFWEGLLDWRVLARLREQSSCPTIMDRKQFGFLW